MTNSSWWLMPAKVCKHSLDIDVPVALLRQVTDFMTFLYPCYCYTVECVANEHCNHFITKVNQKVQHTPLETCCFFLLVGLYSLSARGPLHKKWFASTMYMQVAMSCFTNDCHSQIADTFVKATKGANVFWFKKSHAENHSLHVEK